MKIFQNKKNIVLTLVIVLILLISGGTLLFLHYSSTTGTVAVISQNGVVIKEINLDQVDEPYTLTITSEDGGYNIIRVEKGAIGVIETDCPDHICQDMGMVSNTLYPISCLPHRLVIQLRQEGEEVQAVDSISR